MLLRNFRMDRKISLLLFERRMGTLAVTTCCPQQERPEGRNKVLYRGTGYRQLSSLSSPSFTPTRTPADSPRSRKIRIHRSASLIQHATIFSLPGGGDKRKDYAERRILGFSMDQIFDVVADVEKYQDFIPWCQSSVVKSRRKGHILADLTVGFPPLLESYTSSVSLTKPHLIRAESTQGKLFNQMVTTWKFSPGLKGRPQTCVVDFSVSFEFRSSLTSQLGNMFFNEVVKVMAEAFFNEAKNRYGAESIPSRKIIIVPVQNNKN